MIDDRSERLLAGVHPDLAAVVRRARDLTEFRVTEGLRSVERQRMLFRSGASQTMKSRHLTGHAVDVVDLAGSYAEPEMKRIASAMKEAAGQLGIPIEWGGTGVAGIARPAGWKTFEDSPHFQLPIALYPERPGPTIDGTATQVADEPTVVGPPIVDRPGWAGVRGALAKSKTVLGAQVTLLGGLCSYFDHAVSVLLDGMGEVTRLGPLLASFDLRSTGLGLTVFGVALVLLRRAQAAYGGKEG